MATKASATVRNKSSVTVDSTVAIGAVEIDLVWTPGSCYQKNHATTVGAATGIALSNTSGDTKAWNGKAVVDATAEAPCQAYNVNASESAYPTLANTSYTLTIAAEGNVRVTNDEDAIFSDSSVSFTGVTITFNASGVGSINSGDGVDFWVSLKTNNPSGMECLVDRTASYPASTTITAGDVIKVSDTYYVAKKGFTSGQIMPRTKNLGTGSHSLAPQLITVLIRSKRLLLNVSLYLCIMSENASS